MNTCGRICVHHSGDFVLVSNRGHQSIAILRVIKDSSMHGQLSLIGFFHTHGETPRHFQFDATGQFLIIANQDSDTMAVFHFDDRSGKVTFTGNDYNVPSPNFVCCCSRDQYDKRAPLTIDNECNVLKYENGSEDTFSTIESNSDRSQLEKELAKAKIEIEDLKRQVSTYEILLTTK